MSYWNLGCIKAIIISESWSHYNQVPRGVMGIPKSVLIIGWQRFFARPSGVLEANHAPPP